MDPVEPEPLRWRRPGGILRDLNIVALLIVIAVGAALLLLPRSDDVLLGLPKLSLGARSPRTIKSPLALIIPDPRTTAAFQDAAAAKVPPVYDLQLATLSEQLDRLSTAFGALRPAPAPRRAAVFTEELGLSAEAGALGPLLSLPPEQAEDAAVLVLRQVMSGPILPARASPAPRGRLLRSIDEAGEPKGERLLPAAEPLPTLAEARVAVDALVAERFPRWSAGARAALSQLCKRLLRENVQQNLGETARRRRAARLSVRTVVVPIAAGETVIAAGEPVDEQKLLILEGMQAELSLRSRSQVTLGSALLVLLMVVVAYRIAAYGFLPRRPTRRDLTFMAFAFLFFMLASWAGYQGALFLGERLPQLDRHVWRAALPVASGVLLMRVVLGMAPAAAMTTVVVVTAGWMMDASLGFSAYVAAGGLAAASVTRAHRPRALFLTAFLRIALAQVGVGVAVELLNSRFSWMMAGQEAAAAALSALLSVLVVVVLVPAVETIFGYTTVMRLGDLASLNHPLLRELLVEAPGTYHHSIMVGTMAERACRGLTGASPLLARVGGYYHDIGKLKNPRAFMENEPGSFLAADPLRQAAELIAHVDDGVALARARRLGRPVRQIIAEHHGHGALRAPLEAAERRFGAELDRALFHYSGPGPSSKEAGLVMLADQVEAATSRQGAAIDPALIGSVVEQVVREVVERGELARCPLSFEDVARATKIFTEMMTERAARRGPPPLYPEVATLPPPVFAAGPEGLN